MHWRTQASTAVHLPYLLLLKFDFFEGDSDSRLVPLLDCDYLTFWHLIYNYCFTCAPFKSTHPVCHTVVAVGVEVPQKRTPQP